MSGSSYLGTSLVRTLILTRGGFVGPESQTGAFGWGQVRAQQPSVFIGWCPAAAGQEEEVTYRTGQDG